MRILVFGASGATGKELVTQALTREHSVTAFVRDTAKLSPHHSNLTLVQADVRDYGAVEEAVEGHDAVLSALGVSVPLKNDPAVVQGVRNIVRAMEHSPVRRLVYLSTLAVREGRAYAGPVIQHFFSRLARNEIADHEEKEKVIASSQLEWTIVRAPRLTHGRRKGEYRFGEYVTPVPLLPAISRADVADFMLRLLAERAFLQKKPSILY